MSKRKEKISKKAFGTISQRECTSCGQMSYWDLCIVKVWFKFLFIPLFPYKKKYCLVCSNCNHYLEIEKSEFDKLHNQILSGAKRTEPDILKYINKNSIQINYLKTIKAYK